jgi:hypothetical protein
VPLALGDLPRPVYDTAAEPGGVLLTACGNRRKTIGPACPQVYKRDARQRVTGIEPALSAWEAVRLRPLEALTC